MRLILALTMLLLAAAPSIADDVRRGTSLYWRGDYGAAAAVLKPLARDGNVLAQFAIAVMYDDGRGLPQDFSRALSWYRKAAHAGLVTYQSRPIPRSALRIPFGQDGYTLYGGETGYYWCGGAASYTDAGIGAVNNPPGAPADCKGHGFLGSGWDFSESDAPNTGLTLCGGDGSYWLTAGWAASVVYYGGAGGAQAIWVR